MILDQFEEKELKKQEVSILLRLRKAQNERSFYDALILEIRKNTS